MSDSNTVLEQSNSEQLLDFTGVSNLQTTALDNVQVIDSSHLTLEARTVKGLNLRSLGAFVGIWSGLDSIPRNLNDFVGIVELTALRSDGESAAKKISVGSGVNLNAGFFTIGLFLRQNDMLSISATVMLIQGVARNPQPSSLFADHPTNSNIPVSYFVPSLVLPVHALDWLSIYRGSEVVHDFGSVINYQRIISDDNIGLVNIQVLLGAGNYIVQLSPGDPGTISATHSFTLG